MAQTTDPVRGDDVRWAAIAGRDATADGTFVYGVVTTGVYCRPSCPSRRARPANIRLFATAGDAEATASEDAPDLRSLAAGHDPEPVPGRGARR